MMSYGVDSRSARSQMQRKIAKAWFTQFEISHWGTIGELILLIVWKNLKKWKFRVMVPLKITCINKGKYHFWYFYERWNTSLGRQ